MGGAPPATTFLTRRVTAGWKSKLMGHKDWAGVIVTSLAGSQATRLLVGGVCQGRDVSPRSQGRAWEPVGRWAGDAFLGREVIFDAYVLTCPQLQASLRQSRAQALLATLWIAELSCPLLVGTRLLLFGRPACGRAVLAGLPGSLGAWTCPPHRNIKQRLSGREAVCPG